jgi:uncharacterized protein YidB (DUF937 family)
MSGSSGPIWTTLTEVLGLAQGLAGGGFPALLAQLENAGLAETVMSWVGHGDNIPVTEAELETAFSPEQLNDWAEKAGVTPDALLSLMAEELPGTVDRATQPKDATAVPPPPNRAP